MEEPKDKRTKAYKQWKETYGLGDLVSDIIPEVIKKAVGDCLLCEERRRKWNKVNLFKKHRAARCLTDEQVAQYKEYKHNATLNIWQTNDVKLLIDLYAHAFAIQYHTKNFCINCNGSGNTLKHIESQLDTLLEKQEND